MSWDPTRQARFDQLRRADLAGTLSAGEETELAGLVAELEADEARQMAPGLAALREEQGQMDQRLGRLQRDNEALSRLLSQHERLAADARRWLAELDERHCHIQQSYTALTGHPLSAQ